MSKVLVIPDSHLKLEVIKCGLELADKKRADHVVLLGDYFDDWYALPEDYYTMLYYLKKLLRIDSRVIMLLGNHELSYMGHPCAGHNGAVAIDLYRALYHDHRFYFAAAIDGVLYSHAGVCTSWLKANKLITQNELRYKLTKVAGAQMLDKKLGSIDNFDVFAQVGHSRGGKNYPSPLWADLSDTMVDALPGIKQVVGHTPISEIQNIGKVWYTDVFSNNNDSDEYLFVVDGSPTVLHYNEEISNE